MAGQRVLTEHIKPSLRSRKSQRIPVGVFLWSIDWKYIDGVNVQRLKTSIEVYIKRAKVCIWVELP